jgi:sugar lactone lactonase YvrE
MGLVSGGGKYYFLDGGLLQSFDKTTEAFQFEADGFGGNLLLYEGAPWVIDTGMAQTVVNGQRTTIAMGGGYGFADSAASDGQGHLYVAYEGFSAATGGTAQGAYLLVMDTASQAVTPYLFRPWGPLDDARSVSSPYSSVVVDSAHGLVYILSCYHHDITRIHLADGTIDRFPDARITEPAALTLDAHGGVAFCQYEGLMTLSSTGTYSCFPWPGAVAPYPNGHDYLSGIAVDDLGRTWVAADGGMLFCMLPNGQGQVYTFSYTIGGSHGWLYAGWLLWDQGQLWLSCNGGKTDPVGNLLSMQIAPTNDAEQPGVPVITTTPVAVQLGQYQPCTLSMTATGNGALTYQWYLNGTPIPWATSSNYGIAAATGADVGAYTCVVTNQLYGQSSQATTPPVALTLIANPAIASFTVSPQRIQALQPATVLAQFAGGTGVLNPGGITVTPGVPVAVSPATTTTYQLTVTNPRGTSVAASLTLPVDVAAGLLTEFSASPAQVDFGQSTTLAWGAGGAATRVSLQDDLGLLGPSDVTGSTSMVVTPARRQTLILTATAPGASGTASAQVAARGLDRIAGSPGGQGELDGQGADARMSYPGSMAVKADGTLIFADSIDPVIRQVSTTGLVTTISGCYGSVGNQGGAAAQARYTQISGLAVGPDGTLFILDHGASTLSKLSPNGQVTTVATLTCGGHGAFVEQMCCDASGNLYVPLMLSSCIMKVTAAGAISTVATGINSPNAVAVRPDGTLVVISGNAFLVVVGTDGSKTNVYPLIAADDPNGPGAVGELRGLTADGAGNLYVAGKNGVYSLDGSFQAHSMAMNGNTGSFANVAWSSQGYLWASFQGMGTEVWQVVPGGGAVSIAGQNRPYLQMGQTTTPGLFNTPCGIAQGPGGTLYVADPSLSTVSQISPQGVCQFLQTGPTLGSAGWASLWCDAMNRVVYATWTSLNRYDSATGQTFLLVAANPAYYISDGSYGVALVGDVKGIVGDAQGNIYFLDTLSEGDPSIAQLYVRKVGLDGSVVTLAGGSWGFKDGQGASAAFGSLRGLCLDRQGNLLAVDQFNHAIRKVTPQGYVTTIAGGSGQGYLDGPAGQAKFSWPSGIAVDGQGNILVADTGNASIRLLTPDGTVSTLLGNPTQPGTRIGGVGYAGLLAPADIQVTANGDLLVTDSGALLQFTAPMQP